MGPLKGSRQKVDMISWQVLAAVCRRLKAGVRVEGGNPLEVTAVIQAKRVPVPGQA